MENEFADVSDEVYEYANSFCEKLVEHFGQEPENLEFIMKALNITAVIFMWKYISPELMEEAVYKMSESIKRSCLRTSERND